MRDDGVTHTAGLTKPENASTLQKFTIKAATAKIMITAVPDAHRRKHQQYQPFDQTTFVD